MPGIKVLFADGKVRFFHVEKDFIAFNVLFDTVEKSERFSIHEHSSELNYAHDFMYFIARYQYFYAVEENNIIYSVSSVVSVESVE